MASERMEWVEIIEPRTKEHMYANLTTGECVWDPPPGVAVKKTDNNQWWELFDQSTSRFYYYNATSQKTVWHRPTDCDIIPLAKLQTLKQNTEPANSIGGGGGGMDSLKCAEPKRKETVSTQTQTPTVGRSGRFNHHENPSLATTLQIGACKPHSPCGVVVGPDVLLQQQQTSPPSPSPSSRRHHHHHHHHHNNRHQHRHNEPQAQPAQQQQQQQQQQPQPQQAVLHQHQQQAPQIPQQPPPPRRHHNHSQDSGRSSDSSVSHSRTSLESGSYRLLDSPHRHHHRSPNQPPPPPISSSHSPLQSQSQSVHTRPQGGGTMEMRGHSKSGTLEATKNQKSLPPSEPPPPLGLSLSTSTPLFKKKTFAEPQRETRRDVNLDFEKSKNGRVAAQESVRSVYSQPPDSSSTSPYRESGDRSFRQQEPAPTYRPPPPDIQQQQQQQQQQHNFGYKSQSDKYRSLMESSSSGGGGGSGRYQREPHRDRVNSLDKSNPAYYGGGGGSVHARNANKQQSADGTGSIGRRHHGCSVSLSEANVREMYGAMMAERNDPAKNLAVRSGQGTGSNVAKQRSFDVMAERDSSRGDREKEFRRAVTCNNSVDNTQQPLARSFSFVQQQKQLQQQQQQQQQQKLSKQSSRRRDRDDDSMHERYLMAQGLDTSQQRLSSASSSSGSSSSGSQGSDSSGSNSAEPADECEEQQQQQQQQPLLVVEDGKKKRTNGNPSPPPSPFYGNLLVDPDHLLPLQHYILQQAKLSGCYKFGDPLLVEEGDDSLDEEGGRGAELHGRADDDSDDQFADDEAASNQGDSSSQEYLEDHYADLGNYDTAGLATYYNTADTLTRPQATPPPPPNIVSQAEARESIIATRPISLPTPTVITGRSSSGGIGIGGGGIGGGNLVHHPGMGGFGLSGLSGTCVDTTDYDEARKDDGSGGGGGGGGDIEKYAQDNLNLNCGRPKGLRLLFRKKFSVRDILSWSKDPIPQPMLVVVDGEKLLKREACNLFRLVQVYMGDRKANVGMTLDGVAMEIANTAYSKPPLRDELYVQICRQTTENPRKESLRRGWELMAVCLAFVPPSATFEPCLEGYMNRHRDPNFQFPEVAKWPIHVQVSHYATVACRRLQRIGAHGKRQPRKSTLEDIDQARLQIFRASMFGATLSEVMALQRDRFPQRELPWIQTTLARQVLIRGGTMTEGIFRVSADADEVSVLKARLDRFEDGAILAASQDAHAPASLLKLWVRELYEPLIPDSFYAECVNLRHEDAEASAASVAALVERLPELNRRVLCHLIHFLQIFARPDVVARTKMDASNLAMVMAPNILRCTSQDPRVILENARKEMAFVRTMIETLETAWVEDLH